jgi:NAD-dependent dihydropyrimidine dehydrogenase PreA subunit
MGSWHYVIGEPCVDIMDRSCLEECPVDCIYIGSRILYIHPGECIACGACSEVCPSDAIRPTDELSSEWEPYATAAKDLFERIGSPGGAEHARVPIDG